MKIDEKLTAVELRKASEADLLEALVDLRKEQFNLRMQQAVGQDARPDQVKKARRNIARVKTVLRELRAPAEERQ